MLLKIEDIPRRTNCFAVLRFWNVKIFDFVRSGIAQLAERFSVKEDVVGSSPTPGASSHLIYHKVIY